MQTDFDVDVLMGTIQRAAMRRGLFVTYFPMLEKWTVADPVDGGKIVGDATQLETIFDVLDEFEIVNDLPLDMGDLAEPTRLPDFSPARRREVSNGV